MLYCMAMVISLCIAGKILLFPPCGIKKKKSPYLYQRGTTANALRLVHTFLHFNIPHLTLCNVPLAACSMQHNSRTALQFVHAICKSTTDHTLPYIQRVTWICLATSILQPLSMWALLMVITTMYAQLIVLLSTWYRAVSLGIYHGWWPTLTCVLTATLKLLPWEGLLSCRTDEAVSYINQSVTLVIPILKIIFRLCTELKSTKHAPILWWNYGGTPLCTSSG